MEKVKVKISNNDIYGIHLFLAEAVKEKRRLGSERAMFCLALLSSELKPIVEAIDSAKQPSDEYIEFVKKMQAGEDMQKLQEEYRDAIEKTTKQNEELSNLAKQEIEIEAYKIKIDDLIDCDFHDINLLQPILEL